MPITSSKDSLKRIGSGKIDKEINDYFHSQEEASADQDFTKEQMLKYIYNLCDNEAKSFKTEKLSTKIFLYAEAG